MKLRRLLLLISAICLFFGCGDKGNDPFAADMAKANALMRSGKPAEAHEKFDRLADRLERAHDYDREAMCFYQMATNYLNQRDTAGMQNVVHRMETLYRDHPSPSIGYSYYSVLQTWYAVRYELYQQDIDRDEMFRTGAESIRLIEAMTPEELRHEMINPVWNYYNMAVGYDLNCSPPRIDSIVFYLDKARKANRETAHLQRHERQQGDVSIRDQQAWLYYYDGEYALAEKEMKEVLALIDSVEMVAPNTVLTEKGEAYGFLVELYQATGRLEEALAYQQLKNENDMVRFGVERNAAVREVEAKYDVEKAQSRVSRMSIVIAFLVALVLLLAMTVLYYRLVQINRRQRLRSEALEALVKTDPKLQGLLDQTDPESVEKVIRAAEKPLSPVEKKYIVLFLAGKSTEEISATMNVTTSSVYTMRYRIRKKFPEDYLLPF